MNNTFNISRLAPKVHENRNYESGQVRHLNIYPKMSSSVSGQYGSRNFPKLVELINAVYNGAKIYFVDTRQDTHFELNDRPASLKRIVENDDNTGMTGYQVTAKEKEVAAFFVNKMVTFIPKDHHGKPWEEMIHKGVIVKDFIENAMWGDRHAFIRFSLNEHGPLTDSQVEECLILFSKVDADGGWLHANSIVGDAAAILLIMLKDIFQNASVDSLQEIIARYEGAANLRGEANFLSKPTEDDENRQEKLKRAEFINEFYAFAKTRSVHQGWCDWKEQRK